MKAVKVLLTEDLLAELDNTAEVREKGRSVVLRQLVRDFLRQHREREIDAQYERAYKEVAAQEPETTIPASAGAPDLGLYVSPVHQLSGEDFEALLERGRNPNPLETGD